MKLKKILLVDDEFMNVQLLQDMLEDKNFLIETAYSGEEALEKVSIFLPDVIILDVMMPGIDGYEVCKRIRANIGGVRFTKIIFLSGRTSLNERLKGYNSGGDDYISKPIIEDEFLAKIDVFMRLKQAEEIDQIKSDLLTLFSHETKTPLNAIFGFCEILNERSHLNETEKSYVANILDAGKQLLKFVEKTTLLCELKKGMTIEKCEHSLESLVYPIVNDLQPQILLKNLFLEYVTINERCFIQADKNLISFVFKYIIENAIKFSPSNSIITISFEKIDEKCHIRIADQGEGIPVDWQKRIFDPFAIQNIKHHHKGQGLSLAIAKHIVEHHHGSIKIDTSVKKGATFVIIIPSCKRSDIVDDDKYIV